MKKEDDRYKEKNIFLITLHLSLFFARVAMIFTHKHTFKQKKRLFIERNYYKKNINVIKSIKKKITRDKKRMKKIIT